MEVWQVIVIMTAAALAVLGAVGYCLSRCRFTGRGCGGVFQIPWRRALWVQHFHEEYILRCLHCGKKGWCTAKQAGRGMGDQ